MVAIALPIIHIHNYYHYVESVALKEQSGQRHSHILAVPLRTPKPNYWYPLKFKELRVPTIHFVVLASARAFRESDSVHAWTELNEKKKKQQPRHGSYSNQVRKKMKDTVGIKNNCLTIDTKDDLFHCFSCTVVKTPRDNCIIVIVNDESVSRAMKRIWLKWGFSVRVCSPPECWY